MKGRLVILVSIIVNIAIMIHIVVPHHHNDTSICIINHSSHHHCEDDACPYSHQDSHEGESESDCVLHNILPSGETKHFYDVDTSQLFLGVAIIVFSDYLQTLASQTSTFRQHPFDVILHSQDLGTVIGLRAPPMVG